MGGDTQSFELGANGTATGSSTLITDGSNRAFLQAPGGAIQNLGTLGGSSSNGTAVTDGAVTRVVGYSNLAGDTTTHAFLYIAGGVGSPAGSPQMRDLGTLSGTATDNSLALGINTLGQVVGNSINAGGEDHAFRTSPNLNINGTTDDLGTLGGITSVARAIINSTGQAVGDADLADGTQHAFRSAANGSPNTLTDLGTLGGSFSGANGINTAGQVVGESALANGSSHAFVWTQGSTTGTAGNMQMTDLGTLFGVSQANAINDSGVIVGFSFLDAVGNNPARFDAFLYSNSSLVDLNSLISPTSGWILQNATAINNNGQITGYGLYQGQERAFVLNLSAAPEPSALCVLVIGMGALGMLAARKRRAASAE